MSKLILTLEQLHLLRHRAVEDLSRQLSSQRQLCQRFEKNISALRSLACGMSEAAGTSAALLTNHSGYKRNLQRVIDWQKQEQALASLEAQKIQGALLEEAKREKSLELVLDERKRQRAMDENRRDQKNTDAVSAQCWLRQKLAQR
ncbi:flagellar export protein FliJ [Enterobacteriaceae bacterium H20N1]|uniref:Flagellar FliJ protein n=1 Tax=Dryocola boscaweniae TaxID=2925397 RepID=A0A9X2W628_9ENTR|nr:flagellar export protein FliJ [Dryocola boscaweniae]MCT4701574.1 flagellar export protein FliJ [Dryocola boscaweniae]MCT4716216.1 flagellar export protein FliJ [Dryocola boscaweniae]MCT4718743.1 flagellar export protein FliJ [Dryocola boscaweniae]